MTVAKIGDRMPNDAAAEDRNVIPLGFKCTDIGNGERLVARYRDVIRYCPPRRRWLVYDGKRWKWDETREIVRFAKATVRGIYHEAASCSDEEVRKAIGKHARASENASRLQSMILLGQSEAGIAVLPNQLDADAWAFNVANGTINLQTGKIRPHERLDLITKIAAVEFNAAAASELWEKFLTDATGGDAELAAYLRRAVGYALQGHVTEKCFWFLFGPPDGMKSTFIDAVSSALGEYAAAASFTTWLVQTNTGGNRGDLVALMNARLVCSVEVRKGARFDEEILKKITGGDLLTAAAKFEAEITFKPSFSIWLAANDAPTIRDDDEGAWSRVRRVPFNNPLPAEQRDPKMRERLRSPDVQAAILAWAVRGCLEWQREGLGTCAAVEKSSAAYRNDMDRIAGFFAERCRFEMGATIATAALRDVYEAWCREQGVRSPLSGKELAARLHEHGAEPGKSNAKRVWKGVRLLDDDEEPEGQRDSRASVSPEVGSEFFSRRAKGNGVPSCPSVPAGEVSGPGREQGGSAAVSSPEQPTLPWTVRP